MSITDEMPDLVIDVEGRDDIDHDEVRNHVHALIEEDSEQEDIDELVEVRRWTMKDQVEMLIGALEDALPAHQRKVLDALRQHAENVLEEQTDDEEVSLDV